MIVNINELQCMLGRASTLLCIHLIDWSENTDQYTDNDLLF